MVSDTFTQLWHYDTQRPSLADYRSVGLDPSLVPELEDNLKLIGEYQRRLRAVRSKAVLLVVHGLDASGKDSLIRTLTRYADPAGFHAWSFGRPQGAEAQHDFLWRITPYLPAFGELAAFNRSHYEGVIAERIWPVRSLEHYNWHGRYESIRSFERHLVQEGTTIIKCWLELSPDEQTQRLIKRLDKPRKQWKFDASDIDGWHKRDLYLRYTEEAIAATHTPEAPWLIIPGDEKPVARAIVAGVLAEQLERLAPGYPPLDEELIEKYRSLLAGGAPAG